MTMIERVARAMGEWRSEDEDCKCIECKESRRINNEVQLIKAKAAIKAMREPTEEMLLEATQASENDSLTAWRYMIDAALKE